MYQDGWYDARSDEMTALTMPCCEIGERLGGWRTTVFYPDIIDDGGDPEIDWFHLTEKDAAIGHQMAMALLASDWVGGDVPDIDVLVSIEQCP